MQEALAKVDLKQPSVPVISNVRAQPVSDPAEIKRLLVSQVTGMVRWRECVLAMVEHGLDAGVDAGLQRGVLRLEVGELHQASRRSVWPSST